LTILVHKLTWRVCDQIHIINFILKFIVNLFLYEIKMSRIYSLSLYGSKKYVHKKGQKFEKK